MAPSKILSGFRLNAPQINDDSEVGEDSTGNFNGDFESSPFGRIAEDVEDPQSGTFEERVLGSTLDPFGGGNLREQPISSSTRDTEHTSSSKSAQVMPDGSIVTHYHHDDHRSASPPLPPASQYQQKVLMSQPQEEQQPSPVEPQSRVVVLPVKFLMIGGILIIMLLIALLVIVSVAYAGGKDDASELPNFVPEVGQPHYIAPSPTMAPIIPTLRPTQAPSNSPTANGQPTQEPQTTLGRIQQRGYLRCGVGENQAGFSTVNLATSQRIGFDVDICRAVAAAMFGEAEGRVEYIPVNTYGRFRRLLSDDYDMLSRTTTHTMQRAVKEESTNAGFSFSIPYLYQGLKFAGKMPYVECADNLTVSTEACSGTRICAVDSTTHVSIIQDLMPNATLVSTVEEWQLQVNFAQGFCNVMAAEQFTLTEQLVRQLGYDGEYVIGNRLFSKEPLAIVTRDDNLEWSDFVNWVLQALLAAEEVGTSSRTSQRLPQTTVFGDQYAAMFQHAVGIVGNFGEIYRNNLEELSARPQTDQINSGDSGLIYAMPFGSLQTLGDGPTPGGTLEAILARGHLRCGISRRLIFAQLDTSTQRWDGFDVDFCRALSSALFNGVTDTVVYTDLPASERFQALQDGTVDVLSRLTTVTLSRDVKETATNVGFQFSQPNFYDGLTFGGIPPFTQCADRLDVTSFSCRGLLICVNKGTTFETRLQSLFPERFIVPRDSGVLTVEGLASEVCNVVAGGVTDVSLTTIRNTGYDGPYTIGAGRFSKDPLALVTRQGDEQWSKFVYWVVSAIFHAEEQGITKQTANEMPVVSLFGPLFVNMFRDAIGSVGNYGEIYERRAEGEVPRGGLNLVNIQLSGPQHYPLPGTV